MNYDPEKQDLMREILAAFRGDVSINMNSLAKIEDILLGKAWFDFFGFQYVSATTVRFSKSLDFGERFVNCLFYCTSANGSTKRYGRVISAAAGTGGNSGYTVLTLAMTSDLASDDTNFKISTHSAGRFTFSVPYPQADAVQAFANRATETIDTSTDLYITDFDCSQTPGTALTFQLVSYAANRTGYARHIDKAMSTSDQLLNQRPAPSGVTDPYIVLAPKRLAVHVSVASGDPQGLVVSVRYAFKAHFKEAEAA